MRLSPRLSIGSSRRPNHLSRRFASRHFPLLVVLLLAIAVVLVFVDRSRADGGEIDTTFNPGGAGANSNVYALAVQPDGKIVIGGAFPSYNGDAAASDMVITITTDGCQSSPVVRRRYGVDFPGSNSRLVQIIRRPDNSDNG